MVPGNDGAIVGEDYLCVVFAGQTLPKLYASFVVNYHTLDGSRRRPRTHSESRGQVSAEIDGLLDDLNRMKQQSSQQVTRWSSMGTMAEPGGRYTTTLTRRHMKRGHDPVELYVKQPVSY